jgi:hypothetical protein
MTRNERPSRDGSNLNARTKHGVVVARLGVEMKILGA